MQYVELTINNKVVSVDTRSTILQACETAGIGLSRFCYHENLSVAGNCRRCLVEVYKSPKPVVACARPVTKGIIVFTDTPLARKARESVLEFRLLNHPLDCPICDQGGECDLQDEALTYGSDRSRYFEFKRSVENKECGPIVKTIITRCIHCTRCVRFSTEVAGNEVRGMFGRGEESAIGTYVNSFINTELSGNLVDLCPVGALTSKPYAYKARSWELESVDTVDFFDAITSNIVVYKATATDILRVLPRADSVYRENWISDRTRYAFDGLKYTTGDTSYVKKNDYSTFFPYIDLVIGSQTNIEIAYTATSYVKSKGIGVANFNFVSTQLPIDVPYFYSLNKSFTDFGLNTFNTIFQIGTNLRYEASLLNTIIRREQNRRGIAYFSLSSFSSLRYAHTHQGNSFSTLYSVYENRLSFVQEHYVQSKELAIVAGVNSFRHNYSSFYQEIIRQVGKLFFVKLSSKERLGFIHNSVGSLAFSHLGFSSKKLKAQSIISCAQPSYIQSYNLNKQLGSSFLIDITASNKTVQAKSLYETAGSLISCHGQMRKHSKVINEITDNVSKHNFEVEMISLWMAEKSHQKLVNIIVFEIL